VRLLSRLPQPVYQFSCQIGTHGGKRSRTAGTFGQNWREERDTSANQWLECDLPPARYRMRQLL